MFLRNALMLMASCLLAYSCSSTADNSDADESEVEEFDYAGVISSQVTTPDLRHYELAGPVKSCRRTTFYDVVRDNDNKLAIDTAGRNIVESTAYFSTEGSYIAKEHERIRRDENGRIEHWEDRAPNYPAIHPGYLKDSYDFEHIDENHHKVSSPTMVSYVITDDYGRIIGEQIHSNDPKFDTSAHNVYRKYDKRGNWTERLTIWTTHTAGDSLPTTRYSIDRRRIIYY